MRERICDNMIFKYRRKKELLIGKIHDNSGGNFHSILMLLILQLYRNDVNHFCHHKHSVHACGIEISHYNFLIDVYKSLLKQIFLQYVNINIWHN